MNKKHTLFKRFNLVKPIIALALFILGCNSSLIFAQNWNQIIKTVASDRGTGDIFGYSVAISGDYAIVGAWQEDHDAKGGNRFNSAGSAYIFKNNAGTWSQVQKIVASDRGRDDQFGYSVAISGDYAIVGAVFEDHDTVGGNSLTNAGSAYIFKNNAGTWTEVKKIVASDRDAYVFFGFSVAISGNYAIVGAHGEDKDASGGDSLFSAGSAYIFKNNAGNWSQVQKIVASDRGAYDQFGNTVAISGDYAIVGSSNDEDSAGKNSLSFAGAAYIFKNNAGTWSQVQKIVALDKGAVYDGFASSFATSVAISGDYVIVGAYKEDHDATGGDSLEDAGAAYIFKNNAGTWSQVQKIVASDRGAGDEFGNSVSISGDYAVVGANFEDSDKTGKNSLYNSGSAYIFKNHSGTWIEDQKIVALDRESSDEFGFSVAISGYYCMVGALFEEHNATGGNKLFQAGSAYIFKKYCATVGTDVKTACKSFTWIDGKTYTSNNDTATFTILAGAANGCDSLVTLNLIIKNISDITTTTSGNTITANNTNANYQWLNCNNNYAIIQGENNQFFSPNFNGSYAVELKENGCVDTSACVAITTVGIIENTIGNLFTIYPNPTSGQLTIVFENEFRALQLTVRNVTGIELVRKSYSSVNQIDLTLEGAAGIYFIEIVDGDKRAFLKVIKD